MGSQIDMQYSQYEQDLSLPVKILSHNMTKVFW